MPPPFDGCAIPAALINVRSRGLPERAVPASFDA